MLVATEEAELPRLERILERAQANGAEARLVDAGELRALEPHAAGLAALHSPRSAIVDYPAICRALAAEMRERGATVRTSTPVERVGWAGGALPRARRRDDPRRRSTARLRGAPRGSSRARGGRAASPRIVPFRGEYWRLRPARSDLVRGLVYPVPDPSLPFLGVHLTRTIQGSVIVGPNAVTRLCPAGLPEADLAPAELWDTLSWPGTWRIARRHWASGAHEVGRSLSKRAFVREARRYVPELAADDVIPAPAGVRAQAVDRDGTLVDDFGSTSAGTRSGSATPPRRRRPRRSRSRRRAVSHLDL